MADLHPSGTVLKQGVPSTHLYCLIHILLMHTQSCPDYMDVQDKPGELLELVPLIPNVSTLLSRHGWPLAAALNKVGHAAHRKSTDE